jgi:hypothetical protein
MNSANSTTSAHAHEWVVFSTDTGEGWLMLQCVLCGKHAAVEDPSRDEWAEAFYAPSRPYRWLDESRVRVKDSGVAKVPWPYVVRAAGGEKCECYEVHGVLEPRDYERVPVEVLLGDTEALTAKERADLDELAEDISTTDLCSFAFPHFLRASRQEGMEPVGAAFRVAARMEALGMHCSAPVVAHVLRQYARAGRAEE